MPSSHENRSVAQLFPTDFRPRPEQRGVRSFMKPDLDTQCSKADPMNVRTFSSSGRLEMVETPVCTDPRNRPPKQPIAECQSESNREPKTAKCNSIPKNGQSVTKLKIW